MDEESDTPEATSGTPDDPSRNGQHPNAKDVAKVVASRVRQARTKKNMSLRALAEKAGISQNSLANYESRGVQMPLRVAVVLARTLDVSADWLLGMDIWRDHEHG